MFGVPERVFEFQVWVYLALDWSPVLLTTNAMLHSVSDIWKLVKVPSSKCSFPSQLHEEHEQDVREFIARGA